MSMFIGKISNKSGLRSEFYDLPFGSLVGANSQATAVMLCTLKHDRAYVFISNDMDAEVSFFLVHPELDPAVTSNRLLWLRLGPDRVINFAVGSAPNFSIDAGTKVYIAAEGSVPTAGSLKLYGQ
jgi:hypothetical protein